MLESLMDFGLGIINRISYEMLWTFGIALLILLFFLLLRKLFVRYVFKIVLNMTSKTKTDLDEKLLTAFERPLRVFFVVLGIYFALNYLPLTVQQDILVSRFCRSAIIILMGWGFYNLTGTCSNFFEDIQERLNFNLDKILIPFISKITRFLIVMFTVSIVAQEWDYNIDGLITGLGLGGLAFALAAKDTVGNIFGGVVIITDKPFSLGDWIETPSVEGVVEDINFRSTRIRTFAHALIIVPNSSLVNEPITNWSRMGKRRITFNLGVTYNTPKDKLKKVVDDIRDLLYNHPEVNKETIFVNFDKFNDSSLDIFLYFFSDTTNWGKWLSVKEDINFKIMGILEQEGVSVAFPSRSIYIENGEQGENLTDCD